MSSFRPYNPEQSELFGYVNPDDRIAENDPARFVDELVEALDLSDIEKNYSAKGCKGYDPRILVKLFLLGYMEGIVSSRRLMRSCQRDMAFVLLCRGQAPDFRTIARFRKAHRNEITNLFKQTVKLAMGMGMGRLRRVALDSTTMKANASANAMVKAEKVEEELAAIEKFLGEMEANDRAEDAAFGEERRGDELPDELASTDGRKKKIAAALRKQKSLKEAQSELKKGTNEKVNTTDPDCAFRHDGRTKQNVPGYGCQAVVSEDQLIVAAHAGTEADSGVVAMMIEQVKENTRKDKNSVEERNSIEDSKVDSKETALSGSEFYADSGYYSVENINHLEKQRIVPIIPDQCTTATLLGNEPKKPREGFTYDAASNSYRCPASEQLFLKGTTTETKDGRPRTRNLYANPEACRNCPLRESCCGKAHYKQLRVTGNPAKVEAYLKKFSDPETEKKYRFRKQIERLFGHIKGNLRFRQFLCRGQELIAAEWSLLCMSFNALRMYNEVWKKKKTA